MKRNFSNFPSIAILALVAIVALSPVWVPVAYGTAMALYFTPERVIAETWHVNVPKGFKRALHISDTGFHGEGRRYTVFEGAGEWDLAGSLSSAPNEKEEAEAMGVLERLGVPADDRPQLDEEHLWGFTRGRDAMKLVVMYFPAEERWYFIETLF